MYANRVWQNVEIDHSYAKCLVLFAHTHARTAQFLKFFHSSSNHVCPFLPRLGFLCCLVYSTAILFATFPHRSARPDHCILCKIVLIVRSLCTVSFFVVQSTRSVLALFFLCRVLTVLTSHMYTMKTYLSNSNNYLGRYWCYALDFFAESY